MKTVIRDVCYDHTQDWCTVQNTSQKSYNEQTPTCKEQPTTDQPQEAPTCTAGGTCYEQALADEGPAQTSPSILLHREEKKHVSELSKDYLNPI